MAQRAELLLDRGEHADYRALFAQAREIAEPQERYRAYKALAERGLAFAAVAPAAQAERVYAALARDVLGALEIDPREPVLANYVGVCLYELGARDAAADLFRAVRDAVPELPHVSENLEHIARRRGTAPPALDPQVRKALVGLEERGRAAAAALGPVEGLTMSLCMIVRDEEDMLGDCLEAVAPAVDQIIIVDTGSTDSTVEIARAHGARVLHHEWTGSFAEARNVSLDAATSDWILYLDADEVLVAEDRERLAELKGRTWREAFYLVETHHTGDIEDGTAVTHNALRVWRNRPGTRFEGRVHEQVAQHFPGDLPERFEPTGVRVQHYGYLGAVRDSREKSQRNIELLEKQAAEGIDSPFQAFNLGSEYAAVGDSERALPQFARAWDLLRGSPDLDRRGFVPSLVNRLVKARVATGDLDGAERNATEGLDVFPGFTDLVLEQSRVARARGDEDLARALLRRCLEMGDAPSRYSPQVGCGTYVATLALAELVEPTEAVEMLTSCLAEFPAYLGTVLPLTHALLATGTAPAEAASRVEEAVAALTPSVRFMLGTALYEAGHAAEAQPRFEGVLERQPASGPARVALVECLLSQTRWNEAAVAAREVAHDSPQAGAAARSELFALLAEGRADEAATASAAHGPAVLSEQDRLVFSAWCALTRGQSPEGGLPADAAPLLASVLEALLRVEEIDAFALLVPAVELLALPRRDRHEVLAAIYLRRGYLESAADEWIAACELAGPDPAAMLGLAQVALARGFGDDARTFAEEALALDPEHPRAAAARRIAQTA